MAVVSHIIVFTVTTGDKFCDGDERVLAGPTVKKSKHRWRIMEGSIAVEEAITEEEAAPQFADDGCTNKILRLIRREAEEDCVYDFSMSLISSASSIWSNRQPVGVGTKTRKLLAGILICLQRPIRCYPIQLKAF